MDKKISEYEIANCINVLGNFCGKRDIDELTAFELMKKYGVEKADTWYFLAVLFWQML